MTQSPAKVLVVGDETPIRTSMSDILRRRGYEVVSAASGEEALGLIHQQPFDLFLLDLRLPGLSGIDVAQRGHELQPDAAIIILTGHGSLDSAVEGIHLGIFDYLLKTSSPQQVLARVAAAIAQQQDEPRRRHLIQTLQSVAGELTGLKPVEEPQATSSENWITLGDLQISTWRQVVRRGNTVLMLTPTE